MKTKLLVLPIAAFLILLVAGCSHKNTATNSQGQTVTGQEAQIVNRLQDSGNDLMQLMNAPDNAIPSEVLKSAKCVAVVPDMVKGGFVFGGNHGKGVATCRDAKGGWSAPAFFTITGGTWGAQIGLESVDLVMVAMNDKGMQDLLSDNFKLGAEGAVAAGPLGREASANTDWKMKSEILVYSRAKGLFAGLDLSGAAVRSDKDSTRAFYGKEIPPQDILNGAAPKKPDAEPFLQDVQKAFSQSKSSS